MADAEPPDHDIRAAAEAAFGEYFRRSAAGEDVDWAAFCAKRPALADELRELHAKWLTFESFCRHLKEKYGEGIDPTVTVDDPSQPDAPAAGDSAWTKLVEQLSSHSPKASRYKLEGEIDRGGMGAIIKVWDEDLRRHLAMKVVLGKTSPTDQGSTPAVDDRTLGRFLEEAQVTGQLDHPGVVPVHELGIDDEGLVYFTMRLVKGRDLRTIFGLVRAAQEGWNQTRALGVLLKACEALAYAHSKGVIHRDLKPANMMVGRFGEVYVMDWGLARVVGRPDRKDTRLQAEGAASIDSLQTLRQDMAEETPDSPLVTMDGDVLGTPAYMSPEQARGDIYQVNARSDVYAMGAILYELLTGQMPYVPPGEKRTQRTILAAVLEGPPRAAHDVARGVPLELEAICEKAMARDAAARYRDVRELAEDLRAYLEGRVVKAHRTGAVIELRKWVVRNKGLAAALAAGVLLLVGGLTTSLIFKAASDRNAALATLNATQATQRTNDVLSLSAQRDLDDLMSRADSLWPAYPEMVPAYETWLSDAHELLDGRAAEPERGRKARPSLAQHKAKLADLDARAVVQADAARMAAARSHPRFAELQAKRAEWTWYSRMLGLEPWPSQASEAAVEAALAAATLPSDARHLNDLAWTLVDPDKPAYGQEVKALLLARRAIGAAVIDERAVMRGTLAWALFRLGRLDEALAEKQRALEEAPAGKQQEYQGYVAKLRQAVAEWRGDALAQRSAECAALQAEVESLAALVGERAFADPEDAWWNVHLSQLVSGLAALQAPTTGLMGDNVAEPHGWGVRKRYEFAQTIHERSVDGPEAQARWAAALAAIATSPKYDGLVLTPQLGLLPIGADHDSGLWEFWHMQSGDEPQRGADGKLVLTESMGVVLVLIPGGTFWMGAQKSDPAGQNYDPGAQPNESPVQQVTLSPYFLSKYELTQGQWERFTGTNPSQYRAGNAYGDYLTTLSNPVEQVSWDDAMVQLPRLGLELPTEAQWERGARGGTDTEWSTGQERETLIGSVNLADQAAAREGAPWPDIKDWPELNDGRVVHAAAGSFRPNAFGLHDVHGNVWEWCRDGDASESYGNRPSANPFREPAGTTNRRVRGGNFSNAAAFARSAYRFSRSSESRDFNLGVRPAREITP